MGSCSNHFCQQQVLYQTTGKQAKSYFAPDDTLAHFTPTKTIHHLVAHRVGIGTVLELDELWSFVFKKANERWVWIALCRPTRQVVAYAVGDRSKRTCLRLWQAIPTTYRQGQCFTDFWASYQAVIPEKQHTAVGKETGETAHVERWNHTLRQRLARFVL